MNMRNAAGDEIMIYDAALMIDGVSYTLPRKARQPEGHELRDALLGILLPLMGQWYLSSFLKTDTRWIT